MKKIVKMKNQGLTLIEMVVAFAVLGIAVLAIGGFFVISARSYTNVNAETTLQSEAQMSLNQIESMLIDSTLGVNYNFIAEDGANQFVLNDGAAEGTATEKVLYVFNADMTDASKYLAMMLKWVAEDECIYYKEVGGSISKELNVESIDISGNTQSKGWDLLAEGVTAFAIDLSMYEDTKKVGVTLELAKRDRTYATEGTITLRNNVLINEKNIEAIYENVDKIISSTITGVEVTANPEVSVPGGRVQLKAKVTGTGYPSQDIYRWVISTTEKMDKIIFDSLKNSSDDSTTYIDTDTQVLYISEKIMTELQVDSTFHQILYVQAYALTGELADDGKTPKTVKNDTPKPINIKAISNIVVTPSADLTLQDNNDLAAADVAQWKSANLGQADADIPKISLHPGNIVQMTATVTGSSSLTDDDKAIVWSIVSATDGTVANIDATGKLEIGKYSQKGSFYVMASLNIDRTKYVYYQVVVGSQYDDGATLEMSATKYVLDRGASTQCTLLLNGKEVDESDYNWSVVVVDALGQTITGNPITVSSEGLVYVGTSLSYDYKYTFTVFASLKSNSAVSTSKTFSVPKVTLTLTPQVAYAEMGTTLRNIICTVTGIVDYNIKWTMAKETNPNYYFSASGNTNITGYKTTDGRHAAEVKLGADEPEALTYMRVKATLSGYENYFATMKINTIDMGLRVDVGAQSVNRGKSTTLSAKFEDSSAVIDQTQVEWSIVSATVAGTALSDLTGLSIDENGVLTVAPDFALANWNKSIVVTASATYEGIIAKGSVTVPAVTFTVSPGSANISENSSQKFTATLANITLPEDKEISWKLTDNQGLSDLSDSDITMTNPMETTAVVSIGDEPSTTYFGLVAYIPDYSELKVLVEIYVQNYTVYAVEDRWEGIDKKVDTVAVRVNNNPNAGDEGHDDNKHQNKPDDYGKHQAVAYLKVTPEVSGRITWTVDNEYCFVTYHRGRHDNTDTYILYVSNEIADGSEINITASYNERTLGTLTLTVNHESNTPH